MQPDTSIDLSEWLRRRDTEYVPSVRAEENERKNISDGTPFGQALTEMAIRDLLGRVERIERQLKRNPPPIVSDEKH